MGLAELNLLGGEGGGESQKGDGGAEDKDLVVYQIRTRETRSWLRKKCSCWTNGHTSVKLGKLSLRNGRLKIESRVYSAAIRGKWDRPQWLVGLALLVFAALTYIPFLSLPPLPDDYLVAEKAELYGWPAGWGQLAADPLYRCRATSMVLTAWLMHLFGFSETAFNITSVIGHMVNTLLVYWLGSIGWIGWRISAGAAFVFAIRERHHEAVVWMSALPEVLVMAFVLGAALTWSRWLEGRGWRWLLATGALFVLALLSKESGVVLGAVLPMMAWMERRDLRLALGSAIAFGSGAVVYFGASLLGSAANHHFSDGTFALQLGFARVLAASMARNLWVWGGLSILALLWVRFAEKRALVGFALFWLVAGLLPYSFLTYMPRVPSRHHYVASLGMALVASIAFWLVMRQSRHRQVWAVILPIAFLLHQWTYLWSVKRAQFDDRARPIEMLLDVVRVNPDTPIHFRCGEFLNQEARRAIRYRLGPIEPNISMDPVAPVGAIEIPCAGNSPL